MRRIFAIATVSACAVAAVVIGTGAADDSGAGYEIRAIFDNVSGAVEGEDVKIAGARVGAIKELDVTEDKKAIVVLELEEPGFARWITSFSSLPRPASAVPNSASRMPRRSR